MPARGPYAKTSARRQAILEAALRLIAERGFGHATIQQVADAVGMTKAGVLHHFGSRDGLLLAVLERRDEIDRAPEGADGLTHFVEIVRHNADVPGLVELFAALTGDPNADAPRRAFLEARYRRLTDSLTAAVRAAQEDGRISAALHADAVATMLVALADGLQTQWLLDPTVDMAGTIEAVLAALGAPRPGDGPAHDNPAHPGPADPGPTVTPR